MIFKGHCRLLPAVSGRLATAVSALVLIAVTSCLLIPQRSLSEGLSSAAELQMMQETLAKYVPKVGPLQSQVAPVAMRSIAALSTPVPVVSAQAAPTAQSQTISISGKVIDPSGAVIPGVLVKIKGDRTELSATTDATGAFAFPQALPEGYRLEASLPGFKTNVITFRLEPGTTWRENVYLSLAGLNTSVEVSASRPTPVPSPATTLPPGKAPPLRVGGDISQAQLIYQQKPQYPAAARAAGLQGEILIQAIIGRDGSVMNPVVVNGNVDAGLAQAALQAVSQWRYKPAMLNAQPVEILTTISVNFTLVD